MEWGGVSAFFSDPQSEAPGLAALLGLFQVLQSQRQGGDREAYQAGSSQDAVPEWEQFVTEPADLITEERLRDDRVGLLAAGPVEPRYFTQVLKLDLEARVEHRLLNPPAMTCLTAHT